MADDIHIRQIMSDQVTMLQVASVYHFQHSKNHPNLQFTALHIYIAMGIVVVIMGFLLQCLHDVCLYNASYT